MRTEEINKWIDEGGDLPQDLTQEEEEHLTKLGWSVKGALHHNGQKWWVQHYLHGKDHGKREAWWDNGQKWYEWNYLHGMQHGVFKSWYKDGNLTEDEEYFYGNRIK